jgi:hypothetical protein
MVKFALHPLHPQERVSNTHLIGRNTTCSCWQSNQDFPAHSLYIYQLSYPGQQTIIIVVEGPEGSEVMT